MKFYPKNLFGIYVTWLISQQFSCRDLKPVAFPVSIKSQKISKPAIITLGTCPLFWSPWLSALVCNSKVFVQTKICYQSKRLRPLRLFKWRDKTPLEILHSGNYSLVCWFWTWSLLIINTSHLTKVNLTTFLVHIYNIYTYTMYVIKYI